MPAPRRSKGIHVLRVADQLTELAAVDLLRRARRLDDMRSIPERRMRIVAGVDQADEPRLAPATVREQHVAGLEVHLLDALIVEVLPAPADHRGPSSSS